MVTPVAKREAVAHLCETHGVSQRRACSTIGADRTLVRYRSVRPDDRAIRDRLREIAAERRRFGYRRLHILLGREGVRLNHKKLRRLYREERLQVRRRGGRKRALGTRAPMTLPAVRHGQRPSSIGHRPGARCGFPSGYGRCNKAWPPCQNPCDRAWRRDHWWRRGFGCSASRHGS